MVQWRCGCEWNTHSLFAYGGNKPPVVLWHGATGSGLCWTCREAGRAWLQMVRNSVGTTNPLNAAPSTIRADLALDIGRNPIHASGAPATAERELGLWLNPDELVDYTRDTDRWIFE